MHSIDQLAKGAKLAITKLALLYAKNAKLCIANNMLSQRRCTKKRRLQDGGSLTVADIQNLKSIKRGASQLKVTLPRNALCTKSGPTSHRCCIHCGEHRHNIQTYKNRKEEPKNSKSNNTL